MFSGVRGRSHGGWKGAMPHPGEATGVRDGTISLPEWDVHSGYAEGISLGGELGAIAQGVTVRGAF